MGIFDEENLFAGYMALFDKMKKVLRRSSGEKKK